MNRSLPVETHYLQPFGEDLTPPASASRTTTARNVTFLPLIEERQGNSASTYRNTPNSRQFNITDSYDWLAEEMDSIISHSELDYIRKGYRGDSGLSSRSRLKTATENLVSTPIIFSTSRKYFIPTQTRE